MPLPRKSSPRRRERRSRSRSHSPRSRRRSRSRSRSRERRRSRSRSAQRRRSPERKRSPVRRRSPSPRKRSRSPRRRSHSPRRSRSHSPRRRSRSHSPRRRGSPPRKRSSSPGDRIYPVKRPADSSVKRQSYRSRSRSASPAPVKKSRDERLYRDESPYEKQRPSRRSASPSHRSPYSGKMYADNPPSSRQPLFPAGTSKRAAAEIDYVTIVEKGPKKEKLNKRFETLEQAARGPFDFEENITIGIHRGPQHIQLDGDEDIEVNYDFNPKTFKMLFPKKDYVKAIFDRDEIKAFHHDDILDEEAYVEKRTISIKPVDKPKSRKYNEEMDYKITVGTGREGYGDRRMVHDSRSQQRPSRSSGYEDIPVTVRLDPKPDPRYEKIYREQQRFEDHALMHEKVNRDPNDLRYNLMRRRSDGDRERGRDARDAPSGAMDARSRIEARRQESRDYVDRRDRPEDRRTNRASPQRSADRKKKAFVKTDLPDFKNRPGVKLEKPVVWIVGSSVVKDVIQFGKAFPEYDIAAMLKDDVSAVFTHGEMDMKIEDLLPAVKYMLKTTERPHMILFQCGEHNVCVGRNADLIDIVKKDLALIKQEIPGVVLVWSQMLPPWMAEDHTGSTLAKSRRRINRFMMQCFLSEEIGGAFLYHSMLRTNLKLRYYMKTSDGFLHLKKKGMKTYIDQLEVGIRYLITGHGSIFPYLKWPLYRDQLTRIEPECMCMLNEEQIQSLDNARLATFSAEQIQGLSTKQILMFHKNQSYFVFCKDFISKLSEKQLEGLTKKHFMHLNNHQISYFQKRDRFMFIRKEVQDFIKKKVKVNTKLSKGRGENPTEYERGEGHVETERENERRQDDTLENLSDTMSESGQSWEDEKEWEEKFGRRGTPENENRYRSYSRECESSYSNSSSEKHRSDSNDRGRRGRKNSFRERYRSRSGSRNRYRSYSRERERSVSRERYRRSCSKERHRRRSHSSERSDSRRNHSSGNIHHVHVPYPPVVPYPGMIPAFRPPPDRLHPFPAMPYPACPPFLPAPRPPFYPVPFPGAYPSGQLPIPWSPASDGAQVGSNSSLEIPSERSSINTRGSGFVSHGNRQDDVRSKWGHCSVCNIPLSSEQHALDHVNSEQHQANENAQRYRSSPARQIRCRDGHERGESSRRDCVARVYVDNFADRKRHLSTDSDFDPRDRKRRSVSKEFERISDDELDKQMFSGNTEQYPEDDVMRSPTSEFDDAGGIKTRIVWIIGTEEIKGLQQYSGDCENYGPNFGLGKFNIAVIWKCERGLRMRDVLPVVSKMKIEETKPNCIVLHVGGNDLEKMSKLDFKGVAIDMIDSLKQQFPGVKLVWSQLLPRSRGLNATRVAIDDEIASYVLEGNGHYIRYPAIEVTDSKVFKMSKNGELDLTTEGILKMMPVLKGGLVSIINRNISIIPVLKNLPRNVSLFVNKNYRTKFANRKPFYKKKAPFYMKKVPFSRR